MPVFENKPNHSVKTEDGKEIWVSRSLSVVVTTLLKKDNELYVLLLQRGDSVHAAGKWCMPCGYLDWDETAPQCALREVWEETGMDILSIPTDDIEYWGLAQPWDVNSNPSMNDKQDFALHYALVLNVDEFIELNNLNAEENEVLDLKWVKLSDLMLYDIAFKHNERVHKFLEYYGEIKIK